MQEVSGRALSKNGSYPLFLDSKYKVAVKEAMVKAIEKVIWRCTLARRWSRQTGSTYKVDVLRSHDRTARVITWTRSRFMSEAEVEFHELRELVKSWSNHTSRDVMLRSGGRV